MEHNRCVNCVSNPPSKDINLCGFCKSCWNIKNKTERRAIVAAFVPKCLHCKSVLRDGSHFCQTCGTAYGETQPPRRGFLSSLLSGVQ